MQRKLRVYKDILITIEQLQTISELTLQSIKTEGQFIRHDCITIRTFSTSFSPKKKSNDFLLLRSNMELPFLLQQQAIKNLLSLLLRAQVCVLAYYRSQHLCQTMKQKPRVITINILRWFSLSHNKTKINQESG